MSPWQRCPPVPNATEAGRVSAGCGPVSVAIPLAMMLAGVAGNALAMLLVSRSYRARGGRRKRSFLLCIGSLALTDMLMTLFGLCPLLIASAMAVERALAIRAPHWYQSHMCPRVARAALLAIWAGGIAFALLPLLGLGRYELQWPGTWCFISARGSRAFGAAFAALGLLSLAVTVGCNLATIAALLARWRGRGSGERSGQRWGRIATETLLQLLGIMCVLSACWAPLLVTMLAMTLGRASQPCRDVPGAPPSPELQQECTFFLTAVRLASLNQILDPWVYLLLRKILLRKFCQAANAVSRCPKAECKDGSITLSEEIRRTAA
ncbi:PE2R3 protein, partial [Pitta sordida]|nr:PE2R3 protein [Pitta sordida]